MFDKSYCLSANTYHRVRLLRACTYKIQRNYYSVAIVKAETIIGHVPHEFLPCLDHFSIQFQPCFLGVTMSPMPHSRACAPISHV